MTLGAAHSPRAGRALVVWRFVDGKPGHENQSRGLLAALESRMELDVHSLAPVSSRRALAHWLRRRYPEASHLPDPDLILGAGHRTHASMLAARRSRGGRAVVLMRPSLPLSWFDLCIIPVHDHPPLRSNVLQTEGVLNAITGAPVKEPDAGLVLVGGPSRHYDWDEQGLLTQLQQVFSNSPAMRWTIATSRRTPVSTESVLHSLANERVRLVSARDTDTDWLPMQLGTAAVAWITLDSVSMVYEALTAGAACGLLAVPAKGASRVQTGIEHLVRQGLVVTYEQWRQGAALPVAEVPFNEAERCARWIEQWLRAS